MIQSRKRNDPPSRPVTFTAAEDLNPFELAELWADRMAWPVEGRTPYDELAELAVMSALARWLQRWQPIAIHSAMLAGPDRRPWPPHSETASTWRTSAGTCGPRGNETSSPAAPRELPRTSTRW
jgi:hypothetical protein